MLTPEEYARKYARMQHRPQSSGWFGTIVGVVTILVVLVTVGVMAAKYRGQLATLVAPPLPAATAFIRNVGDQVPHTPRVEPVARPTPSTAGVYNSEAEAQAAFEAAKAEQQQQAAPTPDLGPLPTNSQGAPVIDETQQQQLNFSAEMAAQEAAQAQAQQQAEDAASRPPDVSAEEVEALVHRDPCSVPRANPHTCKDGLWKPTPVNR